MSKQLTPGRILEWIGSIEDRGDQTTLTVGRRLVKAAQRAGYLDGQPLSLDRLARVLDTLRIDGALSFRDQHSGHRSRYGPLLGVDLESCRDFHVTANGRKDLDVGKPSVSIHNSVVGQLALGDINNLTLVKLLDAVEAAVDQSDASEEEKGEARQAMARARRALEEVGSSAAGDLIASALRTVLGVQ